MTYIDFYFNVENKFNKREIMINQINKGKLKG